MKWICALPLIAFAMPSMAAEVIFQCSVKDGTKTIEITQSGRDIYYAFGPKGAPELELKGDVVSAFTPWPGVGRNYFESVTFFNGRYSYEVFYSFDRLDLDKPAEAGVTAYRDDEQFNDLSCDAGSIRQDFGAVAKEMERVGLCWEFDTRKWAACADPA